MDEPGFISFGFCIHTGRRMYAVFPLNLLFIAIGALLHLDTGQIPAWLVEE